MLRLREQLLARRDLDELPEVHHGDSVAEVLDGREIVRDEQARELEVLLQVAQQVEYRRLHGNIQRGHRLVRDEQARRDGEGARETDALALPARELVRIAEPQLRPQADGVEQLDNALLHERPPHEALHANRLGDDSAAGHPRVQ